MTDHAPETVLAEALNLPCSEIRSDLDISNCASWDSIAHFRVILAIEEAIGRQLTPEEIFSVTDYEGVKQLLDIEKPG